MKFVTYVLDGDHRVGVVDANMLFPLELLGLGYRTMLELIAHYGPEDKQMLERHLKARPSFGIPVEEAVLAAPIPRPAHDVICVGKNYAAHVKEGAAFMNKGDFNMPEHPVYFGKRVNLAPGHGGQADMHPAITSQMDYEAELAVVIGKTCAGVRPEKVWEHLFGLTVANDLSARDIQKNHVQYYFGKSLDSSTPMGPWIVTMDEFSPPLRLEVRSRVNGEQRQQGNTADFIFDIPRLVSQLSQGITLEPGDILLTGTPAGVGMGFNPPRFLKAGDVVECEVEGVGTLRTVMR